MFMNPIRSQQVAAILLMAIGLTSPVLSEASMDLARSKNCIACHSVDKQVLGPAYKEVAAKYAGDKEALARLTKKIREGGVGVWGQVPMPANPQVTEAEAQTLAKWVLGLK
jgi:cytochrome c